MQRQSDGSYSEIGFIKTKSGENIDKIVDRNGNVYFTQGFTKSVSGVPPITLDAIGKPVIDYKICGNSIQDGTPSPENPVEIESVGTRTKNLFDEKVLSNYPDSGRQAVFYLPIYVGDGTFTLSSTTPMIPGNICNLFLLSGSKDDGASSNVNGVSINNSKTVTAENGYVTIGIRRKYEGVDPANYKTQLEKGATATDYEPYGYKIPVVCRGKNLLSPFVSGSINASTGIFTTNAASVRTDYIPVDFTKSSYFLSGLSNKLYSFVAAYDENKGYLGRTSAGAAANRVLTNNSFNISTADYKIGYIAVTMYENVGASGSVDIVDSLSVQLEIGSSATEYEPYRKPVTTSIFLDEPFRKIGDYADYIDFRNGNVVRKIGRKVFTGSTDEVWVLASTNSAAWKRYPVGYFTNNIEKPAPTKALFCDKVIVDNTSEQTDGIDHITLRKGSGSEMIWVFPTFGMLGNIQPSVENNPAILSAFRQWLSDNPLTVYYPLAEPIEESIELPEIPTFNGTTTVEIDTEIQPSAMEITYKSKKENEK